MSIRKRLAKLEQDKQTAPHSAQRGLDGFYADLESGDPLAAYYQEDVKHEH